MAKLDVHELVDTLAAIGAGCLGVAAAVLIAVGLAVAYFCIF